MEKKKENPAVANIIKALAAACLAYLGYAVGGLLLVAMLNAKTGAGGTNLFNRIYARQEI